MAMMTALLKMMTVKMMTVKMMTALLKNDRLARALNAMEIACP
jgi:hypothetical protein